MKTLVQKIAEQDNLINEFEQYLNLQNKYFLERDNDILDKLKIQSSKIRQMIRDTKKPKP